MQVVEPRHVLDSVLGQRLDQLQLLRVVSHALRHTWANRAEVVAHIGWQRARHVGLKRLEVCEKRIGYHFRDPNHLVQALTHSSLKTIDNPCNERMEFLGDSVLGMVMTEFLFNFFPLSQ